MFDLRDMVQANLFKSVTLPTGNILPQMTPIVFVTSMIALNNSALFYCGNPLFFCVTAVLY